MSSDNLDKPLRMRVFAGPNGSGKSTIIASVSNTQINGRSIDLGLYINADDIARSLRKGLFSFSSFSIVVSADIFKATAIHSGLVPAESTEKFDTSFNLADNAIQLLNPAYAEQLAQIIADFLRKKLLEERKRFSFETVFSHSSKLDIMREAVSAGYKVYLYFVSTVSPEINKSRVRFRVTQGGHDVPEDKIESRYYRSLSLLYEACQIAYQVYFFDNSSEGTDFSLFTHFKKVDGKKEWDEVDAEKLPNWFFEYYLDKAEADAPQ